MIGRTTGSASLAQVVYDDIRAKRRTTAYLHRPPVLVGAVPEPHGH